MNLQIILRTNLKWFILVNTASTLVFLPLLNYFVTTNSQIGVGIAGASYGVVWFVSGLVAGIADSAATRQHHPGLSYAAFSLCIAILVLLAGKLVWPAIMPLTWTAVVIFSFACAAALALIQLRMRATDQGYTGRDLFQ